MSCISVYLVEESRENVSRRQCQVSEGWDGTVSTINTCDRPARYITCEVLVL